MTKNCTGCYVGGGEEKRTDEGFATHQMNRYPHTSIPEFEEFDKEFCFDGNKVFFGDLKKEDGWEFGESKLSLKQTVQVEQLKDFIRANFIPKSQLREVLAEESEHCKCGDSFDATCERCLARAEMENDITNRLNL